MISLATETDRTLFFDFLPLDLGSIRGFNTRFHLYTVPGQVFYDASRKLILKGVDGVIFVADTQEARMEANIESIRNLEKNLKEQGFDLATVPYALQFNKRDLPSVGAGGRDVPHAQLQARADLRSGGDDGSRRLRHPEVGRQADPDRAEETLAKGSHGQGRQAQDAVEARAADRRARRRRGEGAARRPGRPPAGPIPPSKP